jgi:hypothetical protein
MGRISKRCFFNAVLGFGMGFLGGWHMRGSGLRTWLLRQLALEQVRFASARNPPDVANSFVVLVMGQSNVANHATPRGRGGAGTYSFTPDGFFACEDPLPGASGSGGSVWTRWAALRRQTDPVVSVVVACVAQGSSFASDWKPGGCHYPRVTAVVRSLQSRGFPIAAVIWHQGESEAWMNDIDASIYANELKSVMAGVRDLGVVAPIFVCQTSRDANGTVNLAIRKAQAGLRNSVVGVHAGPDTDLLGDEFRADGVHWNARGLDRFAEGLEACLRNVGL